MCYHYLFNFINVAGSPMFFTSSRLPWQRKKKMARLAAHGNVGRLVEERENPLVNVPLWISIINPCFPTIVSGLGCHGGWICRAYEVGKVADGAGPTRMTLTRHISA